MTPRIAHISPVTPALGGNGLAMRTSMFSQAAEQTGEVLIIVVGSVIGTTGEDRPFRADTRVIRVNEGVDTRLWLITKSLPVSSRSDLLTKYGKPLASMPLSAVAVARIIEHLIAFEPDLIILSRAHLLPIADAFEGALARVPLLVDLDDDDGDLCNSLAACQRNAGHDDKALWLQAQAAVYDALISTHADAVDLFTAASAKVVQSIQQRLEISRISCVPNGISFGSTAHAKRSGGPGKTNSVAQPGPRLIFVGNLSYRPNIDGMSWFLEEVWSSLREAVSGLNLMVVGSDPDEQLIRMCQQDGVELIVNPPDLRPLYRLADAAIVPLRFGSGSRIKILEAGAHGVPVISTFAGAEGLNLQPDAHAFISDETADSFVSSCLECLRSRDEAHRRSTLFQAFIEERHDRQEIINKLHKTLRTFVAG